MRIATMVAAALLLSVSPVPAHAAPPSASPREARRPPMRPSAETNFDAAPLETSYPADSLVGKWWTEGKEGLMKIEKTKSGRFQVVLLGVPLLGQSQDWTRAK